VGSGPWFLAGNAGMDVEPIPNILMPQLSTDFSLDTLLNLAHTRPHVLITASGTAKPRKQVAPRHVTLAPPIPAQRCGERALEAAWFLPENRERRKDGTVYWRKHQARYQELSQLAEEYVRADLEFWQELESLSGQRQHFKPGRTDETAIADDEVAA
jgi:hypothetical protein